MNETVENVLELSKNGQSFVARFNSAQSHVTDTTEAVQNWLQEQEVAEERCNDTLLVLAETLNNVVEHAYKYAEDGIIDLRIEIEASIISIFIVDQGHAFDGPPEKKPMGNHQELDLMDLPEGGFGWFLIHSLCREISFSRENNRNRLTLILGLAAE